VTCHGGSRQREAILIAQLREEFGIKKICIEVFELTATNHPDVARAQSVLEFAQHAQFVKASINSLLRKNIRAPTPADEVCVGIPGYRASFVAIHGAQGFDRVHQRCHNGSCSEVETLQQRWCIAAQLRIAVRDQPKKIEISRARQTFSFRNTSGDHGDREFHP